MALQKIHGKGRPCTKPLDLSKTVVSIENPNEELITKEGNETTNNIIEIVPSTCAETGGTKAVDSVNKEPEPEPEPESLINIPSNQPNSAVDVPEPSDEAEPIQTDTPLIVIPPKFWLIQPHEIGDYYTTKGQNNDNVTGDNVKGGNGTGALHDESEGSKETIMSQVEDKVEDMFITEAENNKCVVPLK